MAPMGSSSPGGAGASSRCTRSSAPGEEVPKEGAVGSIVGTRCFLVSKRLAVQAQAGSGQAGRQAGKHFGRRAGRRTSAGVVGGDAVAAAQVLPSPALPLGLLQNRQAGAAGRHRHRRRHCPQHMQGGTHAAVGGRGSGQGMHARPHRPLPPTPPPQPCTPPLLPLAPGPSSPLAATIHPFPPHCSPRQGRPLRPAPFWRRCGRSR